MPVDFDIQGARTAGYTDAQIADALGQKAGFDTAGARGAGHGDAAIISLLTGQQVQPQSKAVDMDAIVNQRLKEQAEGTGTWDAITAGAGRTFDRLGKGMQQIYHNVVGDDAAATALKERADHENMLYAPLKEAHPIATAVGESAPAMVVPIGGTAGVLTTAGKLAAAAAGEKALEYGTVKERAVEAAKAGAGAAVGGVVVPKIAQVAAAGGRAAIRGLAGQVTPEAMALFQRAQQLGIPVNVAQLGDSKFLKTLASAVEQMPFTGAAQRATEQRSAYTRAVSRTFGEDTDRVTPEIYASAKSRLGAEFDTISARNNLNVTPQVRSSVDKVIRDAETTASDDTIRALKNVANRLDDQATGGSVPAQQSAIVGANGQPIITAPATSTPVTIPGATYQSIDTQLSNMIKAGGEKGMFAKQLQTEIRNAFDASVSPADQAAWSTARSQYRNLKAVRNIVSKDADNGFIPPTQLMSALNSTEAGKEVMAMGSRGELGDLGRIGRQFVRDQIPNSGTAQRALAMSIIGGGGLITGMSPIGAAGMVAGSATAGRLVTKLLNDPKVVQAMTHQGLTRAQILAMPPSTAAQILGGIAGMTTMNDMTGEQ